MNGQRLAGLALEQALASKLRDLLGAISSLHDWRVEHIGREETVGYRFLAKRKTAGHMLAS